MFVDAQAGQDPSLFAIVDGREGTGLLGQFGLRVQDPFGGAPTPVRVAGDPQQATAFQFLAFSPASPESETLTIQVGGVTAVPGSMGIELPSPSSSSSSSLPPLIYLNQVTMEFKQVSRALATEVLRATPWMQARCCRPASTEAFHGTVDRDFCQAANFTVGDNGLPTQECDIFMRCDFCADSKTTGCGDVSAKPAQLPPDRQQACACFRSVAITDDLARDVEGAVDGARIIRLPRPCYDPACQSREAFIPRSDVGACPPLCLQFAQGVAKGDFSQVNFHGQQTLVCGQGDGITIQLPQQGAGGGGQGRGPAGGGERGGDQEGGGGERGEGEEEEVQDNGLNVTIGATVLAISVAIGIAGAFLVAFPKLKAEAKISGAVLLALALIGIIIGALVLADVIPVYSESTDETALRAPDVPGLVLQPT